MIKYKEVGVIIEKIKHSAEFVKCFLQPIYWTFESLIDSNVLKRNSALKNLYEGQRCFILGTGASLNAIDISKLKSEFTFGCHFLFKHPDHLIYSFYAVPVRPSLMREISRHSANMAHDPDTFFQALETYYGSHRATIFLHGSGKKYFEKNKLLRNHNIYYVRPSRQLESTSTLVNDLTKATPFMDGVIFFMIAASIYMGFKELYLCGCGYTYQPICWLHFYDKLPPIPSNIALDKRNKILEDIAKSYNATVFDYDKPWFISNNPIDVTRHTIMKDFALSYGVEIFNVVPERFESPVYKKVTWEHIVNNVI